jgi:hypothetical protein
MTQDELLDLVVVLQHRLASLDARVSALETKVDAQSVPAGKGWSTSSFHEDTFNKLTSWMTMPAEALRDLVNGVSDRDLRKIVREDRIAGKTVPGKS